MSSEDQPANVRDLPVEQQDVIQDALEFYLDAIEGDFIEEPEENREAYVPAIEMYHDLTGGWRDRGSMVFNRPSFVPESAH